MCAHLVCGARSRKSRARTISVLAILNLIAKRKLILGFFLNRPVPTCGRSADLGTYVKVRGTFTSVPKVGTGSTDAMFLQLYIRVCYCQAGSFHDVEEHSTLTCDWFTIEGSKTTTSTSCFVFMLPVNQSTVILLTPFRSLCSRIVCTGPKMTCPNSRLCDITQSVGRRELLQPHAGQCSGIFL